MWQCCHACCLTLFKSVCYFVSQTDNILIDTAVVQACTSQSALQTPSSACNDGVAATASSTGNAACARKLAYMVTGRAMHTTEGSRVRAAISSREGSLQTCSSCSAGAASAEVLAGLLALPSTYLISTASSLSRSAKFAMAVADLAPSASKPTAFFSTKSAALQGLMHTSASVRYRYYNRAQHQVDRGLHRGPLNVNPTNLHVWSWPLGMK